MNKIISIIFIAISSLVLFTGATNAQTCTDRVSGDVVCVNFMNVEIDRSYCRDRLGNSPPPLTTDCTVDCPEPPDDPPPIERSCTEFFSTRCTTSFTSTDHFCSTAEVMNRMECSDTGLYPEITSNTTTSQTGDPSDPTDMTNSCTVRSTCEYSCSERNPDYPACLK